MFGKFGEIFDRRHAIEAEILFYKTIESREKSKNILNQRIQAIAKKLHITINFEATQASFEHVLNQISEKDFSDQIFTLSTLIALLMQLDASSSFENKNLLIHQRKEQMINILQKKRFSIITTGITFDLDEQIRA